MKQESGSVSRRGFLASAIAVGVVMPQVSSAAAPQRRPALAVDALRLDAATRADLEAFAEPVLREAAWLDELPLDGITPAHRFLPDGGDR